MQHPMTKQYLYEHPCRYDVYLHWWLGSEYHPGYVNVYTCRPSRGLQTRIRLFFRLASLTSHLAAPFKLAFASFLLSLSVFSKPPVTAHQRTTVNPCRVFIAIASSRSHAPFLSVRRTIGRGILQVCEILIGQRLEFPVLSQQGDSST